MKRFGFSAAFLFALLFMPSFAQPAWACSCASRGPAAVLSNATAVFAGVAVSEDLRGVRFQVDKVWKGAETAEITVRKSNDACGTEWRVGGRYVVMASGPLQELSAINCVSLDSGLDLAERVALMQRTSGGIKEEEYQKINRELEALVLDRLLPHKKIANDTRKCVLPGAGPSGEIRLIAADADEVSLSAVRIALEGSGERQGAVTNARGRATFLGLHPGEFNITADLDGYAPRRFTVQVPDQGCVEAAVYLPRDPNQQKPKAQPQKGAAAISGRALSLGKPVSGLRVMAIDAGDEVMGIPIMAGYTRTDDSGRYRLDGLAPGRYFIVAGFLERPSFYPGVRDLTEALPITIRDGVPVDFADFSTIPPAPDSGPPSVTFKVSGQLISTVPPSAHAEHAFGGDIVPAKPIAALYLVSRLTSGPAQSNPRPPSARTLAARPSMEAPGDGRFEIAVPPGAYDLFVTLPDIKGWGSGPPGVALTPVAFGRTSIEVLEDVNELTVTVHPGVDLKGRVTIDGQPASGANAFQIALQPDASAATIPAFQSIERFRPAIGADGSFLFPALPEANYDVQVLTAVASSIQLTDILLDGKSVLNTGIAIGSTQPGLLEIVLKTRDK